MFPHLHRVCVRIGRVNTVWKFCVSEKHPLYDGRLAGRSRLRGRVAQRDMRLAWSKDKMMKPAGDRFGDLSPERGPRRRRVCSTLASQEKLRPREHHVVLVSRSLTDPSAFPQGLRTSIEDFHMIRYTVKT